MVHQSQIVWVLGILGFMYEHHYQLKLLIYDDSFYGSAVRINRSGAGGAMTPASSPYVYESSTTYGGKKRLCFAVRKYTCCCTGYLWVRWWTNAGKRTDYSWATFHSNSGTTAYW